MARKAETDAASRRRGGPVAGPPGGDQQPQAHHAHQVQRPVLRVEQGGRDHGGGDQVPGSGRCQGAMQRQEPAAREEDHQGVHAGLGGVIDGEGCAGKQDDRRPGDGPAAEPVARQPGHGKRHDADDPRERAGGQVRLAEDLHPEVQQVVVERRCAVVLDRAGDLPEGQPRPVDGQRLV